MRRKKIKKKLKIRVVMKAIIQPNQEPALDRSHVLDQNPDHVQNLVHVLDRVQDPYRVLSLDHRTQRHPVLALDQHPSHHRVQDRDLILARGHDRHQRVLDQFILVQLDLVHAANQALEVDHQAEVVVRAVVAVTAAVQVLIQNTRKDQVDLESLNLVVAPHHAHRLLAVVDHELHPNLAAVTVNKLNLYYEISSFSFKQVHKYCLVDSF